MCIISFFFPFCTSVPCSLTFAFAFFFLFHPNPTAAAPLLPPSALCILRALSSSFDRSDGAAMLTPPLRSDSPAATPHACAPRFLPPCHAWHATAPPRPPLSLVLRSLCSLICFAFGVSALRSHGHACAAWPDRHCACTCDLAARPPSVALRADSIQTHRSTHGTLLPVPHFSFHFGSICFHFSCLSAWREFNSALIQMQPHFKIIFTRHAIALNCSRFGELMFQAAWYYSIGNVSTTAPR